VSIAAPNWVEGCDHTLTLRDGALRVCVYWSDLGYRVACGPVVLQTPYKDLYDAKSAGVALANQIVAEIQMDLARYRMATEPAPPFMAPQKKEYA
jgi:hypothetical protein